MPELLIKNANLVLPDRILDNHNVLCQDGKITKIIQNKDLESYSADDVIDARGRYLAPGFIDLHFHGVHNYLIDNGPEHLVAICGILPQYGVTGFLPTVCPLPKGKDAKFLASLAKVESKGTRVLGFHLEGPFLRLTGILPSEAIGKVDNERVKALIEAAKPHRAIFSISPDIEGIEDLIPVMAQDNTPVFMTHTKANVKQTQAAIELGVRHATHFYDVFPSPPEADPGVRPCGAVEAILADPRVSVDFILDGEHVDPVAVRMALQCKGNDGVCLITDSNIGAGLKPGRYKFLANIEIEFTYEGGPARQSDNLPPPGLLAGSGLTMDRAVRNAIKMLGVDITLAIRMASANPAKVLGLDDQKGHIKEGYDADMIVLDDSLNVVQSWIGGRCCFEKKK